VIVSAVSELNSEVITTELPSRVDFPPRRVHESPKVNNYDDNMKLVTKLPSYYLKTTRIYPKAEREWTRKIENNDVIEDVSTTHFTQLYEKHDHNFQSVANKAKEMLKPGREFHNRGCNFRLCVMCQLTFIVRSVWVTLVRNS